ncbi:hypothetical protein AMAG_18731 [Allomyces macrogynus ATCC 38327]|uniref:Uncharacterized protein n=1 Tax=Allomyces macrogynus (strain ATCC 38327) TaxID=578462 RepID=A0A0L0SET3_ALLM3|nr:hypothetical protein AMAG_18731 [Allomyces macrogynus ATCC 38327]|eukprot:KNE61038.1 hypothetical protein AMAG_18731 [Allomyces macrogynus ATCC 38327]
MYWAAPTSPPHARRPPGSGRAPPPPPPPPSVPRGHAGMHYLVYPTQQAPPQYAAYPPAHASTTAGMHQSHAQLARAAHLPSHGGDTDLTGPTSPRAPRGSPPPPPRDRAAVPPSQGPVAAAPRLSGRPSWSAEAGDLILPMPFRSPIAARSGSIVAPAAATAASSAGTPHGATIAHAVQQLWYAFHMQRATEDAASVAPAVAAAQGSAGTTGQETSATGSATASASGAGDSASLAGSTASSSVPSHAPPPAAAPATVPTKSGKRNKGPRMSNGTPAAAANTTAPDSLASASTSASAPASTTASSSSSRVSSRRGSTASLVAALRDGEDTPTTKPVRKAAKSDAPVAWVGPVPGNVVAPPVRKSTPAPDTSDAKPRQGPGKRRGRGAAGGNSGSGRAQPTAVVPPSPGPSWVALPADPKPDKPRAGDTESSSPTRSRSPGAGGSAGGVSWAQIVQLPPPPPPPAAPAAVSGSTTPAGPRANSPVRDADAVAAAARAAKARDMDRDWRRPAASMAVTTARSGTVTPPVVAGAASPPVAHWTP